MQMTARPQARQLFRDSDGIVSFILHNTSGQNLYLDTQQFDATSGSDGAVIVAPNEKFPMTMWWGDLWIACDPAFDSQPFKFVRTFLQKHSSARIGG